MPCPATILVAAMPDAVRRRRFFVGVRRGGPLRNQLGSPPLGFAIFHFAHCQGAIMTAPTTSTTSTTAPSSGASRKTIGYIVQLGGIAAFTLGAVFSLHHIPIGASFLGGAAAFYVGQKIRALS
jgi:hypothetical protein